MRRLAPSVLLLLLGTTLAAPSNTALPFPDLPRGPIDPAAQAVLEAASPPSIVELTLESVRTSGADGSNNVTSVPSSHPGLPLTPEESRALELAQRRGRSLRGRVIGDDNRVPVDSTDYPWSTIGRLQAANGAICSGALIGARLISVARHCVDFGGPDMTWVFQPNYHDGPRFGSYAIREITWLAVPNYMDSSCTRKYDWAVLVIDEPIGLQFGWLGSGVWTDFDVQGKPVLNSAAYHGDLYNGGRMYFHGGITSFKEGNCDNYGPLASDTDGMGGSSGSAIWAYDGVDRYNLGALSGGNWQITIHGWGREQVDAVIALTQKYPG